MPTFAQLLNNLPNLAWTKPLESLAGLRAAAPQRNDQSMVARIRKETIPLGELSDDEFTRRATGLRRQTLRMESAFAFAVEAVRREMGIELYDVQLLAGLALVRGVIAQVNTGEGKTLIALLPSMWHALNNRKTHVMTVNSYLAKRDYDLLQVVYRRLGLTVGLIDAEKSPAEKRQAYACDIVYGPGYEFGFDFLRDQLTLLSSCKSLGLQTRDRLKGIQTHSSIIQSSFGAALVDEADSILLDEATSPLVLSPGGGRPCPHPEVYYRAQEACQRLQAGIHYRIDPTCASVSLTEGGRQAIERELASPQNAQLGRPWSEYVLRALIANFTLVSGVHYVVSSNEVHIVDQHTGRIFSERTWQDGLHQAVQAKEEVTVTVETVPAARITRQKFLKRYAHLSGMTGTTQGSERELQDIYGLTTQPIAPHRPSQRYLLPTRFFAKSEVKQLAITAEVERVHAQGRPVLVGTTSIRASQELASQFQLKGLTVRVLNGTQDQPEAEVVAQAGRCGAITIATNMAGRGTDIALDADARKAGGLHVIATECHESERVDMQLVGRAARQGDPGSAQFLVSAEDALLKRHAPKLAERIIGSVEANGEVIAASCEELMSQVRAAQRVAQSRLSSHRARMYAHDDWLESILKQL